MVASCRSPEAAEDCFRRLTATSFPRHLPLKVSPYSIVKGDGGNSMHGSWNRVIGNGGGGGGGGGCGWGRL